MTSTGSRRKFQLLGHPSQLSLNHAASSFHFSLQPQKYLAILAIPHHHFFFFLARIILLMELTYLLLPYIYFVFKTNLKGHSHCDVFPPLSEPSLHPHASATLLILQCRAPCILPFCEENLSSLECEFLKGRECVILPSSL